MEACTLRVQSSVNLRSCIRKPTLIWESQRCPRRRCISSTTRLNADVRLMEVGPRDGLQNIKQSIATPIKVELINRLAATGLSAIEATSFVPAKWIPQLADGPDVMSQIMPMVKQGSIDFPVLAPNIKGVERAVAAGVKEVVVFVAASEGFSKKNQNCTIEDALKMSRLAAEKALKNGVKVRGAISCIYSCPYDGPTAPETVLKIARALLDMGCYEIGLGDTLGVGTPKDTEKLLKVLFTEIPATKLAGHFHDTYGQAVANVVKAYDMGIRTFDSSVAGLGGCPYAKGAKGNVSTEDIAYTFEQMGVDTGVDLRKLVSIGDWISRQLGQPNGSRAGAALFAKSETSQPAAPHPTPVSTTASTAAVSQSTTARTWRQIDSLTTDEYSVTRAGNAVKVTLSRPKNGNALTGSMVTGLTTLYKTLAADPNIFHIVLAASGKFFCTGMDLKNTHSADGTTRSSNYDDILGMFDAIQNAPQTTISLIDGPCFAGGVGLAFSSDVRIVSDAARFTVTEVKLGLAPAMISRHMIREWGIPFWREAMLSGREVRPEELVGMGAVHKLVKTGELEAELDKYLDMLAKCAPRSAAACKELIRVGWRNPGGKEQADLMRSTFADMMVEGSEGKFGIEQFGKKIRSVDWSAFWRERSAKL
jgi:hydroxymethylglutaryl-CoA lyase